MKSLFKITRVNVVNAINVETKLKEFFKFSKKHYSFDSNLSKQQMFADFVKYSKLSYNTLKEFDITSGEAIANIIKTNYEKLVNIGWIFDCVSSLNNIKHYIQWKNSEDYVEGKFGVDLQGYEELSEEIEGEHTVLRRILVIDDVNDHNNPATTISYVFTGKRLPSNRQVHMLKQDWHYKTGIKYTDARDKLLTTHLKKYC